MYIALHCQIYSINVLTTNFYISYISWYLFSSTIVVLAEVI